MFEKLKSNPHIAYLLLGIGIFCIGFSAIFVKFANVPGPVSAFYRMVFSGIVIVPYWIFFARKRGDRKTIMLVTAGALFFSVDLALWNTSLIMISAPVSTLLANSAPIWVGIGTMIFFKQKLGWKFWIGLLITFTGITQLVGWEAIQQLSVGTGELLAVTAGVFYSGYLLIAQKTRQKTDTVTFMSVTIITCFISLLLFNIISGTELTGFSMKTWVSLAGLGIVTHLFGWLCITYALGHIKAAPVSVTLHGQSLMTALLAMPLLDEYMTVPQITGGLLVLTGIYIVNERKRIKKIPDSSSPAE